MNKEKDFFKTCVDIVAGLEVKNESQAIAKEVVLSEIENLQQENKKLNGAIQTYDILLKANAEENKKLKDNWIKLKEWLKEYEEGTYGLGSYEAGLSDGLGDVIKKMQELQGSDSNVKD